MALDDLKEFIDKLNNQGKMRFLEAATEEQIFQFEQNNGFKLPIKFRNWLLYSDGGEFFLPAGIQLYGVSHKPLIDPSDDDRPDDTYVVIGALASGDPVLCRKKSEQIAIYNHDANRIEDDEKYEDFFAFLNDLYDLLGIGEGDDV